ncbi:hypothetical protein TcasGA2_TC031383 [Tribolium castaneum]|uniref:Uncharacterized protein n=1 Tax=Tribolium castaneum TaxID=7070 RepID=A0A139WAZ2_TRICA|nr:hypothetical protein TcasGA2_TC031383 [Tribolium castaneum]
MSSRHFSNSETISCYKANLRKLKFTTNQLRMNPYGSNHVFLISSIDGRWTYHIFIKYGQTQRNVVGFQAGGELNSVIGWSLSREVFIAVRDIDRFFRYVIFNVCSISKVFFSN